MKFYKFISYVLHPIIFPIIGTLLYFIILPRHIEKTTQHTILLMVFIGTYLIPLVFMSLLKQMKLISSFYLRTIEERKWPIFICVVVSYVIGILLFRIQIVFELAVFFFGLTMALFTSYLLLFNKFKVSLHTIGTGGIIGFVILISIRYQINLMLLLAILFVISGLIGTSRLKLNTHENKEVYFGYFIGLGMQFLAYALLNFL